MRADLYLHHVRIFKSRSLATQACDKGNVRLAGSAIKPARALKEGDELVVERGDLTLVLRVLAWPEKRVGAPLVHEFMENLTPPENYQRAAEARKIRGWTTPHQNATKPDKKQLRQIRELMERNA
ncbi:MAG: RNA-binding S4 domain-containing protein [Roseimicrobium sp.]